MAGFAGSWVKISLYLRCGISWQGPKIFIFSGSCSTFLFDSFGPGMNVRMNPGDGGFPKRPKLYISNLKRAGFAGSSVKIICYLRGGISIQRPQIVIFSGSCSTSLFDSFGPGMNIRINPCDSGFPKVPTPYISRLKLASFAGSGVVIRSNLRGSILTLGPKIVIFSGSCSTFLFDSFGPGMKVRRPLRRRELLDYCKIPHRRQHADNSINASISPIRNRRVHPVIFTQVEKFTLIKNSNVNLFI